MIRISGLGAVAIGGLILGCSSSPAPTRDREAPFRSVQKGMSTNEVLGILGPPKRENDRFGMREWMYPLGGTRDPVYLIHFNRDTNQVRSVVRFDGYAVVDTSGAVPNVVPDR